MTASAAVPTVSPATRIDDPLTRSLDRLIEDARRIRQTASIADDQASEPEQRYRSDVAVTLAMMEYDVALALAALRAHNARGADELHLSATAIADAARSWADEIKVQTHLATMDVRDRSDAIGQRLERAAAEARRAATRVSESLQADVGEVRRITLEGIRSVRVSLSDALSAAHDA